jgi:N-acetylglucosamine kinase-like BadF-type ATPase
LTIDHHLANSDPACISPYEESSLVSVIPLLLGVDGGGSQTRALLADENGRVLASAEAGASNYQSVGFAAATQALLDAGAEALRRAGLAPDTPIDAACFGLAGIGRLEDQARFEAWAATSGIARRYAFTSDAELVLAAGAPDGWGAALIAGTGSFCWGRNTDGRAARVGGWGYLLGDEGSGYDLAVQALRLATQTADGRAGAHAVLQAILEHWALDAPDRLITYVYSPTRARAEIAGLAAPLLALAESGDPHAAALVEQAAAALARMLAALVATLDLRRPPVAMAGGLLGASGSLRAAIVRHMAAPLGPVSYVDEPARGALKLAGRLLAIKHLRDVQENNAPTSRDST